MTTIKKGVLNALNHYNKDNGYTITADEYIILHDYCDKLINILERNNADYSFSDAATYCQHCFNHIDFYNYHRAEYVILHECEIFCNDCIKSNYLSIYLREAENNPNRALQHYLVRPEKLTELGYIKLNDRNYNHGLYEWCDNKSPHEIYNELCDEYSSIYFLIEDSNPFNVEFSVYAMK